MVTWQSMADIQMAGHEHFAPFANMSLWELHGSLLALIAGLLPVDDKVNFASTCEATRAASSEHAGAWWSGDDMHVCVNNFGIDSFVRWARSVEARNSTVHFASLNITTVEDASVDDMVELMRVASATVSPGSLLVNWIPQYRIDGFSGVKNLFISAANISIDPGMLPPNLEALGVELTSNGPCDIRIPACVNDLTLSRVTFDAASLATFGNLDALALHDCSVVASDEARTLWKQLGIEKLTIGDYSSFDNDVVGEWQHVRMDGSVPFGCYPASVRSLTFDLQTMASSSPCAVYMDTFTEEALDTLAHLRIELTGNFHMAGHWDLSAPGGVEYNFKSFPDLEVVLETDFAGWKCKMSSHTKSPNV